MASEQKNAVPSTRRAIYYEAYGANKDVLKLGSLPVPALKDGEVLIQVHAAGINPIDWKLSNGYLSKIWPVAFPNVVGFDGAGIVAQVGPGVNTLKPGDAVYFNIGGRGTFTDYAVASAVQCAPKPAKLSFEQAAGVGVVFMTAHQCLALHEIKAGTRVLVLGGTSSVGIAGIQLAKNKGAWVAATCSAPKVDLVKKYGADQTIDYKSQNFAEVLKDAHVDVVLDAIGEVGSFDKALPIIKKGGLFVSVAQHGEKSTPDVTFRVVYCDNNKGSEHLPIIGKLFDDGKLTVPIEKVYNFDLPDVIEMFNYSASQRAVGKLVVKISN